MKPLLFFLFLAHSLAGITQNYRLVNPQREAHFEYQKYGESRFQSIRIDSAYLTGSDSIYENYRILSEDWIYTYCQDARDTNFFMAKTAIPANGDWIIFNRTDDTILIKPNAIVGTQWPLYKFSNGNYLRANLISNNSQNVLTFSDSLKTVTIQAYDSGNNPISHPLNGKQIQWSKYCGLTRFYQTLDFPNDTTSFRLVGISNPNLGIANLTWPEIANWNIGDEFHYHGEDNQAPWLARYDWEEFRIINKIISISSDTIIYFKDHFYYKEEYTFNPFLMTPTFIHDTITDTVFLNHSYSFNNLSMNPFFGPEYFNFGYLYQTRTSDFGNRRKKIVHPYFWSDGGDSCLTFPTGWCIYPIKTYVEGIGLVRSEDCYLNNLVYYLKGIESWGTPLNWPSVGEKEKLIHFSIHPNPTTGSFTISSSLNSYQVEISNLLGEIVFRTAQLQNNEQLIDLSNQPKGIYLAKLIDENQNFSVSKLILN